MIMKIIDTKSQGKIYTFSGEIARFLLILMVFLFILSITPKILAQDKPPQACIMDYSHLGSQGKGYVNQTGAFEDEIPEVEQHWDEVDNHHPPTMSVSPNDKVLLLIIDDYGTSLGSATPRSHGEYVEKVADKTLNIISGGSHQDFIVIDSVNYADGDEPTLINVIEKTNNKLTDLLAQPGGNYDSIVLNMSWVILDCIGRAEVVADGRRQWIDINAIGFYETLYSGEEPIMDYNLDGNTTFAEYIIQNNENISSLYSEELAQSVGRALAIYILESSYWDNQDIDHLSNSDFNYDWSNAPNAVEDKGSFFAESMQLPPDSEILQTDLSETNQLPDSEEIIAFRNLINGSSFNYEGRIVAVASSGNFGIEIGNWGDTIHIVIPLPAYAPASWEDVLAVSGSWAIDFADTWWPLSNHGQVKAPAAWHEPFASEYVAGTSFSAPMVGALVSLLSSSSDCDFDSVISNIGKQENSPFLERILSDCMP